MARWSSPRRCIGSAAGPDLSHGAAGQGCFRGTAIAAATRSRDLCGQAQEYRKKIVRAAI